MMRRRSIDIGLRGVLGILALFGAQCAASGDQDSPVEGTGGNGPLEAGSLGGAVAGKGAGGSRPTTSQTSGSSGNKTALPDAAAGASGMDAGTRVSSAGSTGTGGGVGHAGGGGGASVGKAGGGGTAGAGAAAGGKGGGTLGRGGSGPTGGGSGIGGAGPGDAGLGGKGGRGGSTGTAGTLASQTGSDGCTDTLVSNLTIQQIAAYQSVKIPLMTDGAEVAVASRGSSVIQGRQTLFRVFVTPGTGWTAREISTRLTLTAGGGQPVQYFGKKSISKASTEADRGSTFEILVPAAEVTESLRYSVQIVECGTDSSTAGQARFPAAGDADLGVRKTGGLKVKVIPLQVGDLLPDTSQAALDGYAKELMSMYPIDAAEITVGDTLTTPSPVDWETMVDQVRAKRQKDNPPADYYYFGLVKPAQTLLSYCKSACTLGIGLVVTSANQAYGRAAVGVGFNDSSAQYSWTTMAHEIGHNHGREHSPCAPKGSTIQGVDPKYPYTNATLGTWGWDSDSNALFDPAKNTDIMGYCDNLWISDYTYNGLVSRVAAVNGAAMVYTPANTVGKWRVLLVQEDRAPRWGVPIQEDTAADGVAETATIYNDSGMVLTTVTVYRIPFSDISGSMVLIPEPAPDWYAVEVGGTTPHPFTAPVTVPRP